MKTLYFECNSGISGDMTVAALLDLGASREVLLKGLKSLDIDGYKIGIGTVKKCGISACDFNVALHGHDKPVPDKHGHEYNPAHDYEFEYEQNDAHSHIHSHEHRGIDDINAIIDGAEISGNAKSIAKKTFDIIARAEAKVHGLPVEEVHFHEVGAVDSIVDIVAAAICIDNLGIDRVICTPLTEGQGTVICQHGKIPVPAPATLEIAAVHGIPLVITPNMGEMVTPTGIAIVAALDASFASPGAFTVKKTGYGAGKKDFKAANVLRASIIEMSGAPEADEVIEISCNIDDMTGEQLAHACGLLQKLGALDCWCTPVIMKKGRPAQVLSLLTSPEREAEFTKLLFEHTTTIGVRCVNYRRTKMKREQKQVTTKYGELEIKECSYGDICKISVEYESAKKLSEANNIPISEVYREGELHRK